MTADFTDEADFPDAPFRFAFAAEILRKRWRRYWVRRRFAPGRENPVFIREIRVQGSCGSTLLWFSLFWFYAVVLRSHQGDPCAVYL